MSHLRRVWTAMLTRNAPGSAGTDSRIVLIINQDGRDRLHHTFPDTCQNDQERGQANLYEVAVSQNGVEPDQLNNSSIRIGIRGDDQWRPEHAVVWGQRVTGGAVIPLAIETGLGARLSTDTGEGRLSLPLRRVGLGSSRMQIRRLLMLMTTSNRKNAGTDSGLELQISANGSQFVDFDIPDTPQDEQERCQANFYFVPVSSPFAKADLNNSSIRLSIKGADAWKPASFFLFGLDDAAGRPEFLVPLVHLRTWPHADLSTDPSEGVSSVTLSLV